MGYISVHEELKQKNRQNGPGQMLNILGFITPRSDWFRSDGHFFYSSDENVIVPSDEILRNKITFFKNVIFQLKTIYVINMRTDEERINKEIELLCKGNIGIMKIEIIIDIGYKREGSIILEIKDENFYFLQISYLECFCGKNKKETKKLLKEIMKLSNGFWGTVGVEFDLLETISVEKLFNTISIGTCEYIKWNNKIQW